MYVSVSMNDLVMAGNKTSSIKFRRKGFPEKELLLGTTYTTPSLLFLKINVSYMYLTCILHLSTMQVLDICYLINLQKKTENSCFSILFQSKDTDLDSLSHS